MKKLLTLCALLICAVSIGQNKYDYSHQRVWLRGVFDSSLSLPHLASNPSEGNVYYNTVSNKYRFLENGVWVEYATSSSGEANTASNLGVTTYGLFAGKVGVDLQFKSLLAGTNISLSATSTGITITNGITNLNQLVNGPGFITGNQNITVSGDATASGTTSLVTAVTGIRSKAIPSLAAGLLRYNGTAWVFDNSTFLTSFTETDPVATVKTVTLNAGAGVSITGAAQTIGSNPTFTIASTITQYTDENVDDRVNTLLQNGTGISWSYNDAANTLTPTVSLSPFTTTNLAEGSNLYFQNERVDDRVAALLIAGSNITLTYNDAANTLTVSAAGGTSGESNTASNLGTTTFGLFASKVGVDLQFKSLLAGTGISMSASSTGITINSTITQYTDENVDDRVALLLQNGTGITWAYNDISNILTPTISLSPFTTTNLTEGANLYYTDERNDDRTAAFIQNGTGITWSYNDASNIFTPTVSLSPFSTTNLAEGTNLYYQDERVDDRVASLLVAGSNITLTYNDAANTLTIAAPSIGLTSLNGLTAATQTFAVGTSGSDFNISSSTSTHTFNLPDAGPSARGAVTTGTQTIAGQKTLTSKLTINTNSSPLYFGDIGSGIPAIGTNSAMDGTNYMLLGTSSITGLNVPSGGTIALRNGGNNVFTLNSTYNVLVNPISIGNGNTPSGFLEIAAGTTTRAPIFLNSGSLLTTPTSGTIEYNGTHLYVTIGGTRYQLDQQSVTGGGESNTASNLGGGLASFDSKSGVDLRFNSFAATDFDLGTNLISIDATLKSNWNAAYDDKVVSIGVTGTTTKTITLTQQDGGTLTGNFNDANTTYSGSDFIVNGTSVQSSANYNIDGVGTIGTRQRIGNGSFSSPATDNKLFIDQTSSATSGSNPLSYVVGNATVANTGSIIAYYSTMTASNSAGTLANMNGMVNHEIVSGAGAVTNVCGVILSGDLQTTTTVTNYKGVNVVGMGFSAAGTISNYYGFYNEAPTGSGTITNRYSFYNNDASATNYFKGTTIFPALATGGTAPTTSGTKKMVVTDANGKISFDDIPGGGLTLAAGVYTPTRTNVQNVTGSTVYDAQYIRVGDVVTVSGRIDINVTTGNFAVCYITLSLPIASTFTSDNYCAGNITSDSNLDNGAITGNGSSSTTAWIAFRPANSGSRQMYYHYTYRIN
jgi:ribulose bisphosphate carboxylase small subunit